MTYQTQSPEVTMADCSDCENVTSEGQYHCLNFVTDEGDSVPLCIHCAMESPDAPEEFVQEQIIAEVENAPKSSEGDDVKGWSVRGATGIYAVMFDTEKKAERTQKAVDHFPKTGDTYEVRRGRGRIELIEPTSTGQSVSTGLSIENPD